MIDEQALRSGLQKLLKGTESAIRERLEDEPSLQAKLKERHEAAVRAERTEGSKKGFLAFADEAITQSAVHWLLGCVFVRFLEDNGWLDERNAKLAWISGPGERLAIAKDRRTLFLRPDPSLTDRDYLLHVFAEMAKLPGVAGLFDPKLNPLYSLQPTAQGAAKIVEFFQKIDPDSNALIHDFSDSAHGTRFLGDLYQHLSESARKRYALCQTPSFVIHFILDRTLTPALDAYGPGTVRMIDPSCGSGHFLLATFARLFQVWQVKEPGTNPPALVQRALDAVYGVDLNPFAVEISRFRLLIAALESSAIERLADAPSFRFNLAAGDSLLHGSRVGGGGIAQELFEDRLQHFYDTEDASELKRIFGQPYHVVVGNPPYINVSDPVLRDAYRQRFRTCRGKFQLGIPFTERFFDLSVQTDSDLAGWIGILNSNAFMKRSFGKRLVEDFLRNRDITHIIDTSGPFLDDHGTPTVVILARNRVPLSSVLRAVRGKRGETVRPPDPGKSPIWIEIRDQTDTPGYEGPYVSVDDVERVQFATHPWPMGGGGAAELNALLSENSKTTVGTEASAVGIVGITGLEEAFIARNGVFRRHGIDPKWFRPLLTGRFIQDWYSRAEEEALFFYGSVAEPLSDRQILAWFWPLRTILGNRATFSQKTYFEEGRPWWDWHQISPDRLEPQVAVSVNDLATHNHFVLVSGAVLFDQHAPVIKVHHEDAHRRLRDLLAVLNSSSICFHLKQVCHCRGTGGIGGGLATETWEKFYDFTTTAISQIPIPSEVPSSLAEAMEEATLQWKACLPTVALAAEGATPTRVSLDQARLVADERYGRMVALQEELDWFFYGAFGIHSESLLCPQECLPSVALGERAFEIAWARENEERAPETAWFVRHNSVPLRNMPGRWPRPYQELVEMRIAAIGRSRDLALVENAQHKRRWNLPAWEELEKSALKGWLLDRIEKNSVWKDCTLVSCAQLRDTLARDTDWLSVAEIYNGAPIEALDSFVTDLVIPEAVPHLPVLRYTESGLRKRSEWEAVWELQRHEDAGETAEIPVPAKYVTKDMQKSDYWRLRGGLDVPKERFILYPFFQRDSDASPVLGWAGWWHLEQAKALATYYQKMRMEEGWEQERLKPILAGLLDLKPWLLQWHNEMDAEMGERLGEYFVRYAESQCQELGFAPEEVRAWQPPAATAARRGRKKKQ